MFKSPEDNLDAEIEKLLRASNGDNIRKDDAAHIALLLKELPRKQVPLAHKRRLYLVYDLGMQTEPKFSGLKLLMFGASGLLVFFFALTALAIFTSSPGQRLYSYKKTAERLQVNLAMNQEVKTRRELALAEKRLTEAKEVISTHPENQKLTAAALTELAKQTEHVVATIESGETKVPNKELTDKLDNLAKDQLALLNTIKSTPETEPATQKVLSATKQIIAATSEADPADPEIIPVTITGPISAVGNSDITVNNTRIEIAKDTIVESSDSTTKTKPALVLNLKVSVSATKKDEKLIADRIIIDSPISAQPKEPVQKTPQPKEDVAAPAPEETPPPKPGEAKAGFIPEDPNPQSIE